ncbi:SAM-dependent chlorinase/fluorinase [Thermanaerothrix sp. 4228-RoL]|uniref:SAM-dependent chlorinase/fluorinase n=1 Tax=Thermanaerothrix solaris TaxID=3058434 RepID=A0ABU3NMH7_9CHLR|nr:SAM-dependent chlorinase/fluorinase [Thermanaerothrix sp. 4228-RoL]MDT8897393.1 SAM-dependent chlorinase/fluorinase [Thermanaerothrix sp. 4228-RoL]
MAGIVALLTDFGYRDHYVGVMKGVIWGISPSVQIADITHAVRPQNVFEGAFLLAQAYPYFPPESIFVAVVDPGVGTQRRPLAARVGDYFFVAPDNGLLSFVIREGEIHRWPMEFVHLTQSAYWLPNVSRSFHGRDVFAPVAAHLAKGVPLEALGPRIEDPIMLPVPEPFPEEGGWQGQIIYIDVFGNLITNIQPHHLAGDLHWKIYYKDREIDKLVNTFGEGRPGDLIAMFDSTGYLSLCIVNGNAEMTLNARVGDSLKMLRS